jgi:hypothetical protein
MSRTNRKYGLYVAALALTCIAIAAAKKAVKTTDAADRDIRVTPNASPAGTPGAATAPTIFTFDDKKDGIQLQYSSAWVVKPDKDYVLRLDPADGSSERRILFDIPDLPFNPIGFIPMGSVESGYLDDIKKAHSDMHTDSSADHPMGAGVKARLVELSWKQAGVPWKNVCLLVVRKRSVYLLSCRSDEAHWPATRADFDKVMASLKWTK